ncbi:glycosyltransferase family 4 protein [Thalassotalea litorea]|uniref:Glycosyltransferase family 4 protein n=1 Tax=Thalassotalea litorea TaxID=2020715 RepID=A0A5R9IYX4_9GAMM|nr:glycosyltransferase family 4 protein [Thalassotalea litorea]TLU67128.1 glycosyltransferase family 4 protein [Thalassotalea litorea]
MRQNKVVVSLYNTPSGRFSWWDLISVGLTKVLAKQQIDHIHFYSTYTENSVYRQKERNIATASDLNCRQWLTQNIEPIIQQYDKVIIHTHCYYPPTKLHILLNKYSHVRWCCTEHRIGSSSTSFFKRSIKGMLRTFNYLPKHIIAVSKAGFVRNNKLFGKNNQHLVINGIDLKRFTPQMMPTLETVKTGIYVGRIDSKKGVWMLLDAVSLLVHKVGRQDFRLKIVGGNNCEVALLKDYIKVKSIESYIEVLGYQPRPEIEVKRSHFVVIPTLIEEALSLAAIEARRIGRAVVYSEKGGLPETMVPFKTGIKIKELTAAGICDSLVMMLDSPLSSQGISKGLSHDLAQFSDQRMFNEYQELLGQIFETIPFGVEVEEGEREGTASF